MRKLVCAFASLLLWLDMSVRAIEISHAGLFFASAFLAIVSFVLAITFADDVQRKLDRLYHDGHSHEPARMMVLHYHSYEEQDGEQRYPCCDPRRRTL